MTGAVPSGIDRSACCRAVTVCAFYRAHAPGPGSSAAYLGTGLSAGDKCICVVDSP
jgi:hypothetical protein